MQAHQYVRVSHGCVDLIQVSSFSLGVRTAVPLQGWAVGSARFGSARLGELVHCCRGPPCLHKISNVQHDPVLCFSAVPPLQGGFHHSRTSCLVQNKAFDRVNVRWPCPTPSLQVLRLAWLAVPGRTVA